MAERGVPESSLAEELRAIDASLAEVPLPEGLEARILAVSTIQAVGAGQGGVREAVDGPARGRGRGLALAFAAGVLLTLAWVGRRGSSTTRGDDEGARAVAPLERSEPPKPALGSSEPASLAPGLELRSSECAWSREDEQLRLATGCRLALAEPAMELEIWTPTRLRSHAAGVAVDEGVVLFTVAHRSDPAAPAKVGVSGGTIEILGTRFVVDQRDAGGHVDLLTGAIRFRRLDGVVELVEPGQRYRWRTPGREHRELDAPSDPPGRPEPKPKLEALDDPARGDELAQALAEVARLRRAGADATAIAKLDALAESERDARTLEVISYERGTLVERSAAPEAACATWAAHRERFPNGRYAADIARRMEGLRCATE